MSGQHIGDVELVDLSCTKLTDRDRCRESSRRLEHEDIGTRATIQCIGPAAAIDRVRAAIAGDGIGVGRAGHVTDRVQGVIAVACATPAARLTVTPVVDGAQLTVSTPPPPVRRLSALLLIKVSLYLEPVAFSIRRD